MSAITALPVEKRLCEIADMPQPGDNPLYARLMAIKPPELTLNAWTNRAKVSRSFFNDVRKRGNARHDSLTKILAAAGVSLADFEAGQVRVQTEVRGTGMSAQDVQAAWRGPEHTKPVPLVGSAFGGEWSDGVEMIELHLSEVLDYLGRPPSIATDPTAYAVEIIGESMAPRYEPGERVFVSPRSPVRIGDDVIVQLRAGPADAADEDGPPSRDANQTADRVTMVLIKRLVKRGPTFIELRQFNPDTTFRVEMERVAAVHRVRGRL
jgi:phage repressor protein C with HTH and peptisase S24 domain